VKDYYIYVKTGRGHDFRTGIVKSCNLEKAYNLALKSKTPTPAQFKSITAFYVASDGRRCHGYDEDDYQHSVNVHSSHERWLKEYEEANRIIESEQP